MDKIILPRLSIEITTRCNLRCKYCAVGVPVQKEAIHLHPLTVRQYLEEVFQLIDYVKSLEFSGGEPFLHEALPEMINNYMEYKQYFQQFLIVTNGTVKISRNLIETLEKNKKYGVIHISDYGLCPEQVNELIKQLDEIRFPYRVDRYWGNDAYQGGWVDPGQVASHGRTKGELESVFKKCGLALNGGCWRIHKGQLHFCERSARCFDEGFVFKDEFITLLDGSLTLEQKRDKLRAIMNVSCLNACNYCNGDIGTSDKSKRVPAGIQVE